MHNYSKQVKSLVTSLVNNYSKFDKDDKKYFIDLTFIPDFDLDSLAAYLINENHHLSNEATSSDNPLYDKVMRPALFKFMNSTHRDDQVEFARAWKEGVTNYCLGEIKDLLDNEIGFKNWGDEWAA